MTPIIRAAHRLDATELAELLSEIIAIGGTTAHAAPVSRDDILDWMHRAPGRSAWHVAESENGDLLGFQFVGPHASLPADALDISTFVRSGRQGIGVGSGLFVATSDAAGGLGATWINASIRADNAGGLAYYQSRGFEPYGRLSGVRLADGRRVDKVMMRLDLD